MKNNSQTTKAKTVRILGQEVRKINAETRRRFAAAAAAPFLAKVLEYRAELIAAFSR
jgi:hypothetical protein